jgi:hypothetical protein
MQDRGARWAFVLFHVTLGVVILIQSLLALFHSLHIETQSHLATLLPWFAGLEAIAAIMLLVPHSLKIGGVMLLLIFVIALIVHGPADGMPLMVYGAGVVLVMAHGSAYRSKR